jgi:AraC-like DNA-binding protein
MKLLSRKNTVERKLFVSYLWAMILPILFFTLSISGYILLDESRKRKEQFTRLSESIVELVQTEFTQIDEFVNSLSVTNWIEKMMYSQTGLFDYNRFDPIEIRNYNQQLFVGTILNPFLISMDLILNEKNVVFSNGIYLSTLNDYLETTYDLRESKYGELKARIGRYNEGAIIHPVKRFNDDQDTTLYAKTIRGKGDSVIRATVLFTLNMEYILSSANQIANEKMEILLLSGNDLISGNESLWNGLQNDSLYSTGNMDDSPKRTRINKAEFTITANSVRSIDIVLLDRHRSYLLRVYIIISSSIFFLGVIVIGAYLLAKLITSRNYKPLQTLLGIIDSPETPPHDLEDLEVEYTSIYKSYREMLNVSENQSTTIYQQQRAMVEYCWQVMLERTHEIGDSILDKIEEFYPVSGFLLHFCAVVMEGNHLSTANALSLKINQIDGALCHIVPYSRFSCLIHHVTNEVVREDVFAEITKHFEQAADGKCGIGRSYQEIRAINKSYNEATLIVNYGVSDANTRVFLRRDYEQHMSNFYFTIAQETRLANLLRNGDYDSAISIISELLEINMGMNSISPKAMQNLFFAIYLTAIRICGELDMEIELHWEPVELLQSNSIDDISMVVYSYLREVCKVIQGESSQNHHLAGVIKSFVAENITNPNLSMQLVSDHIDKSVSYTSRVFHRLYNMSFIEYINRNRVDVAARMIKETKRALKDISKDVGFSSDISFRRSFIRYKGVTAGKYRKLV